MGENQLDDLEQDEPITMRILNEIAWNFTQVKSWMWWKTVKYGGLISSCYPPFTEKQATKKEEAA